MTDELTRQDPTCPICRAATIYGGDLRLYDGDETTCECERCGASFIVRLEIVHFYHSRPAAPGGKP